MWVKKCCEDTHMYCVVLMAQCSAVSKYERPSPTTLPGTVLIDGRSYAWQVGNTNKNGTQK